MSAHQPSETGSPLRILVVEDELLVADLLAEMLDELGHTVAGTAASVADALALVRGGGFDLALLDVSLDGGDATPVAAELAARRIPYVYTTGYGAPGAAGENAPVLRKPYDFEDLKAVLAKTAASRAP